MKPVDEKIEKYRNKKAELTAYGCNGDEYNGVFNIPLPSGERANVIISNGLGWEHVSVSLKGRCPRWQEMCYIKALFWGDEEIVVQYHPQKSKYVNLHPFCLHLWRPVDVELPTPPTSMIG